MSCAPEHARFNFLAVTAATAIVQQREGRPVDGTALAMGLAASALPSLPDLLEPATNPNHRRFFHSMVFMAGLVHAMHRAYRWEAEEDWEKLTRAVLLVGGAAYLGHLALDAMSPKSLPLI